MPTATIGSEVQTPQSVTTAAIGLEAQTPQSVTAQALGACGGRAPRAPLVLTCGGCKPVQPMGWGANSRMLARSSRAPALKEAQSTVERTGVSLAGHWRVFRGLVPGRVATRR